MGSPAGAPRAQLRTPWFTPAAASPSARASPWSAAPGSPVHRGLSANQPPPFPPHPLPARTPLHKALYLGRLSIAAALLRAGAPLDAPDRRGRLPADLLSSELRRRLGPWAVGGAGAAPARSALVAWGSGANWQLGVGSQELHLSPVRLDHGLSGESVTAVAAAKFHSAAVAGGQVWAWGWARGGRLGIDDALLARVGSRGAAQIVPRPLDGLGRRTVVAVAAAKHHTLAATAAGELWSWGSNRCGALGYPACDTQPTPRR
jgi:hypothetical protein